jgi:hypothetical protein
MNIVNQKRGESSNKNLNNSNKMSALNQPTSSNTNNNGNHQEHTAVAAHLHRPQTSTNKIIIPQNDTVMVKEELRELAKTDSGGGSGGDSDDKNATIRKGISQFSGPFTKQIQITHQTFLPASKNDSTIHNDNTSSSSSHTTNTHLPKIINKVALYKKSVSSTDCLPSTTSTKQNTINSASSKGSISAVTLTMMSQRSGSKLPSMSSTKSSEMPHVTPTFTLDNHEENSRTSSMSSSLNSKEQVDQTSTITPTIANTELSKHEHPTSRLKEDKDAYLKEFLLISTIGAGTFGRVIFSQHKHSGKFYALKVMNIVDIIKQKQIDHVKNEKQVLEEVSSLASSAANQSTEFIVKLFWTHHDEQHLYMLMEYVHGGDFFTLIKKRVRFDTKQAVFYGAEIVCALEFLHSRQICYRDLKPGKKLWTL